MRVAVQEIEAGVSVWYFALDSEWRLSYADEQACRYFRCGRAEALGRDIRDLLPAAIAERFQEAFRDARLSNHPVYHDVHDPEGSTIWNLTVVRWLGELAVYVRDITEQRRADARNDFLREAGKILGIALDLDASLLHIARAASDTIADWCLVYLYQDDGSPLRAAAAHCGEIQTVYNDSLDDGDEPDEEALELLAFSPRSGGDHPSARSRLVAREEGSRPTRATVRDHTGASERLLVPLDGREDVLGVMVLTPSWLGRSFSEEDRAVVEDVARGVALVIDDARLHQALQLATSTAQRQADDAARLVAASRSFAEASFDFREVVFTLARTVSLALGGFCVVRLLSDDRQWLIPVALYHPDEEMRGVLQEWLHQTPWRADEGLPGQAVQERQAVLAPNLSVSWRGVELHGAVVAPLLVRGRVLGTLSLWGDRPGVRLTLDDQSLLQALADRVALHVENTRLWERLAEREREVRAGSHAPATSEQEPLKEPLSEREREVLRLIAEGLTNGEIAYQLHISVNTVKGHVERVLHKLYVADRTQAAVRASTLGLLT